VNYLWSKLEQVETYLYGTQTAVEWKCGAIGNHNVSLCTPDIHQVVLQVVNLQQKPL
jgi:hypothetical protein